MGWRCFQFPSLYASQSCSRGLLVPFVDRTKVRCWQDACWELKCDSKYLLCGEHHTGDNASCPLYELDGIKNSGVFNLKSPSEVPYACFKFSPLMYFVDISLELKPCFCPTLFTVLWAKTSKQAVSQGRFPLLSSFQFLDWFYFHYSSSICSNICSPQQLVWTAE